MLLQFSTMSNFKVIENASDKVPLPMTSPTMSDLFETELECDEIGINLILQKVFHI